MAIRGLPVEGTVINGDTTNNVLADQLDHDALQSIAPDVGSEVNQEFIKMLESVGGSTIKSSERITSFHDSCGSGMHYTFDASENVIVIEIVLGSYALTSYSFDEGDFDAVLIDDTQISSNAGNPSLPYRNFLVRVPTGLSVSAVETTIIQSESLQGLDVVPSPKPLALYAGYDIENRFYLDEDAYSIDAFTRSQPAEYKMINRDGVQGILLSFYPLQYNPAEKLGELALEARITIAFDGPVELQDIVFPSPDYAGADLGNYTIIAPESFVSYLSAFVDWKTTLGFDVFVETLEDIYSDYPTGDGPSKVRSYLNASYNQNSTDYVLLIGDADVMPVREVVDPAGGPGLDNGTEPSDLYYECLDGTWDSNGNGFYGEMDDEVDFMPELMVGRLPVQTADQARSVLSKIIRYEQNPEPGDWLNDFLLIANNCFGTNDGPVMTEGYLNQKYLYDSFFDVYRTYSSDGSLSVSNIVSRLNSGVSIVDFFDHGAYDQWTDSLYTSDVSGLTNGNRTMFAFAMACETGAFDVEYVEPVISEAFFRNSNGGAHTYIGATRVAWAGYHCFDGFHNVYWEYFFETALEHREASPKLAMQQALHHMVTNFDMEVASTLETVYQAIYFGDPSLRMYWKHDVETSVNPVEVNTETTLNGTIMQYNGDVPITGTVHVRILDPLGSVRFDEAISADSFGHFTATFSTSDIPGTYTVETTASLPFESTSVTTFEVGTILVTVALDAEPVYNTFLSFSGTASSDGSGSARLITSDGSILQEAPIVCSAGIYTSSVNVTGFGPLRLIVTLDNTTESGGAELAFQMYRGDVLVIADDSGSSGPSYPGGWADANSGDSSNQGDFVLALQEEYNVSVFHAINDGQPTIELLNQFDVVVVTTGDNMAYPYESPESYLLDILYTYADSGGHILYEGSSQLTGLEASTERLVLSNLAAVELNTQITNAGGLYLEKASHPIMSGIPGTIHLADGLGSPLAEVVVPTNESQSVGSYSGDYAGASAITAQSASEYRGGVVFYAFSIDAIENATIRNTLIQNSLAFLMHPSLLVHLSDDAMQTGTTQRIDVSVEDSGTGEPVENVLVTFEGCGISASNTTLSDGTCSFEITPSSEGLIAIEATKGGYLNYTTDLIVYDTPVVKLQSNPAFLERTGAQEVSIYASDFYEGIPLENCLINLTGLGNTLTGFTNESGLISFTVTPDGPGFIIVEGSLSGYSGSTINLPVIISALVLPGLGTYYPDDCCWDDLMLNWNVYGGYPLDIDYTTFENLSRPITLDLLEAVGADVLILGLPWDVIPTEQIDAIKTYVQSGHGLVCSGGAMYYNAADLCEFFGLNPLSEMAVYYPSSALTFDVFNVTHPVTSSIGNPYTAGYPFSIHPMGGEWNGEVLNGAGYAALESDISPLAAILTYRGMVYMSHIPEFQGNTADCQLIYNSIVWSDYVVPNHDLGISLSVPQVAPGDTVTVTATGRNLGLVTESTIDINLYIDEVLVNTASIPSLAAGATEDLEYVWTPMTEDYYNITATITAVPGEYTTLNNRIERSIFVRDLHNYYMFDGVYAWYDAKTNGEPLAFYGDDVSIGLPLPFSFSFYDASFDTVYLGSNGWLSFENTNPTSFVPVTFPSTSSSVQYSFAIIWDDLIAQNNVYTWSTEDYFVIQFDNYRHLGGSLMGTFEVVLFADGHLAFYYQSTGTISYGTIGLNYGDGVHHNSVPPITISSVSAYGLEFYYQLPEHEMSVGVNCPTVVHTGESVDIEVAMYNLGQQNEYDVALNLYVNDASIYYTIVGTAVQGLSFIHTVEWIVPEGLSHNITAAISVVPGESSIDNNAITLIVTVSHLVNYMQIEDTYLWYDAVNNGTNLGISGDDTYTLQYLDFEFYYYDTGFDWVAISSNGWLSFATSNPYDCVPEDYPSSNPRYAYSFAPIWQDLQADDNIWVWSTSEFFVVQYQNYRYLGGTRLGTFQIVLHSSGVIQFNYQDLDSVYGGTVGLNYGDGIHYTSYQPAELNNVQNFGLTYTFNDDESPEWVEVPGDITREAGTFFTYNLYVSDNIGITSFTVNDTSHFTIDINGELQNVERLAVGNYGLEVRAYDPVGHYASAEFKVRVRDTNGPSWQSVLVTDQIYSDENYELNVVAYDYSGVAVYTVNHTYFAINESQYLYNVVGLSPGVYIIGVTAEDIYGNTNTLTIALTVLPTDSQQFLVTMLITFAAVGMVGILTILLVRHQRR